MTCSAQTPPENALWSLIPDISSFLPSPFEDFNEELCMLPPSCMNASSSIDTDSTTPHHRQQHLCSNKTEVEKPYVKYVFEIAQTPFIAGTGSYDDDDVENDDEDDDNDDESHEDGLFSMSKLYGGEDEDEVDGKEHRKRRRLQNNNETISIVEPLDLTCHESIEDREIHKRTFKKLLQSEKTTNQYWGRTPNEDNNRKDNGGIYVHGILVGLKKEEKYDKKKPSRFCHICLRRAEKVSMVACNGIISGKCRKVICKKCFREQDWDWNKAIEINSNWTCSHCLHRCPDRAQCFNYSKTNNKRHVRLMKNKAHRCLNDPSTS